MIVVGAVGVIPIGNPQPTITEPAFKIALVVLGFILVLLGPLFVWRELTITKSDSAVAGNQFSREEHAEKETQALTKAQSVGTTKYDFRIVSPTWGKKFKGGIGNLTVEVSGTYKVKPPPGATLRLFVKTNEPLLYWRHPPVVNFDERGHKWYGRIDLWKTHDTRPYDAYIIAAVLDEIDEAMVQYASKVQQETGKNIPFDVLPCHIERSEDEVLVFRE